MKDREQLKQRWTRAVFEAQRDGKKTTPPRASFGELSLQHELGRRGQEIEAGHLVATGPLTSILTPEVGDVVDISFANLGTVQLGIVE